MVKINENIMEQIKGKVVALPNVKKINSWTEVNQAEYVEYHVMIIQTEEHFMAMKHYRYIDDGCRSEVPELESMVYNTIHLEKVEFEFIKTVRKGAI